MCLGMFMAILDIQVVVTSLPTIRAALGIAPDLMSWVQTAYLIAEVIAIPLTGVLSRVLTLRGLFAAALSVFTLASIACAASGSFEALIAWRVVQGFAGGVLIPLVFSAVFLLFPFALQRPRHDHRRRPRGARADGRPVGRRLDHRDLVLALGVPDQRPAWHPRRSGRAPLARSREARFRSCPHARLALARPDGAGAGLPRDRAEGSAQHGWTSGLVLGLFAVLAASGAIFVRRTLSAGQPVVHLRTLADRDFAVGCWLSFILGSGLFGSTYLMPVFLAFVRRPRRAPDRRDHAGDRRGGALTAPIVVYLGRRSMRVC